MTTSAKPESRYDALPRTKARFAILTLLAVGTMINYLDRTILGIAAPQLTVQLGLDAAVMGIVFSAFSWTYTLFQIPGGIFLDRFGSRITYFVALFFWSLFTLLQGFATGLYSLLFYRFGLGVSEAPCFPTNARVVTNWFPQKERARATGVYTVGEYVGLAFFSPLLYWITETFGWQALFYTVGTAGILFASVWWFKYRDPHESKKVSETELEYIRAGGGLSSSRESTQFSWRSVGQLLRKRQMVGACIGQFAGNSTLIFFLTWFPSYLAQERGMGFTTIGIYAILPFVAAAIGVMSGGYFSDILLTRLNSANIGRKLPIIAGLLLATTIIGANYVQSNAVAIAIMSIAFFGQGMVGLGWALISDIAPKNLMGLTGGIFNLAANLAGIVTPMVIGFIVASSGSFFGALIFVGIVAFIGAIAYIFILGDVVRIEIDPA